MKASEPHRDRVSGVGLYDLPGNSSQPSRLRLSRPSRLNTRMSYKLLKSDDPDETKSYGSTDSSPAASPAALLTENVMLEDFERSQAANPFLDPDTAAYWKNVYDGCQYECRHKVDPLLTWSKKEEQELVRKLDWKVCLWAVCWPWEEISTTLDMTQLISAAVRHVLRAPG